MSNNITTHIWNRLGYCPACTHKAFLAALISWSITGLLYAAGLSQFFIVLSCVASALTCLWVTHLFAFATKTTTREHGRPALSRRTLIPLIVRAAVVAGVASMVPTASFAQQKPCPWGCPKGTQCCVTQGTGRSGCCVNCYTPDCIF